uniref:Uncharacterized protein n=1 Tax=Noccaea caerulescens TaxID=107243 RepID=A0A1J3F6Y2_NOCCA
MLTRALGRVRISGSRIQGSNHSTGFLENSKLGPIGVSCRRWLSSESGKRFAAMWGSGDYGRLGLGNLESQWRPAVCSALSDHNIRDVACSRAQTLFLNGETDFRFLEIEYLKVTTSIKRRRCLTPYVKWICREFYFFFQADLDCF